MTLFFHVKDNGVLLQVPAITDFTGIPNQILGTNLAGLVDSSIWTPEPITRLTDVDTTTIPPVTNTLDILRWDGSNYVPSKEKRSFTWTVYEPSLGNGIQQGFRFNGVPSTNSRFRSPYPAIMNLAVSSSQDTDDWTISIFVNGVLTLTLTHPLNTTTLIHTPNLILSNTDEVYVQFARVGGGSVADVTFEMHLLEIV